VISCSLRRTSAGEEREERSIKDIRLNGVGVKNYSSMIFRRQGGVRITPDEGTPK